MNKIESFQVDHTKLKPGIYISRTDDVNGNKIYTYDIRLKTPNKGDYLTPAIAHTIEHIGATFLRNIAQKTTIYWGPMGCQTGFYFITTIQPNIAVWQIKTTFKFISDFDDDNIPGASEIECGQYKLQDLEGAKQTAKEYYNIIKDLKVETINDLNY